MEVEKKPKKFSTLVRKLLKMDLMEKRNLAGYVFVLPVIIGLIFIFLPSMIQSLQFSMNELLIHETGFDLKWKGMYYYHKAFMVDPNYRVYLLTSLRDIVINMPVILIFSFFMAILLNRKQFPGRTFFRVVFFLPVIIYSGVASSAGITSGATEEFAEAAATIFADPQLSGGSQSMQSGLSSIVGMAMNVEMVLQSLSLGQTLMTFIMSSISRLEWIIQSSGVQIIVFLSALQSISPQIFEAASVEGLTSWEMFWKITLPMISPMILVNSIYTIIDSYTNTRYQVLEYIQTVAFIRLDQSFGAALAFVFFLCIILIVGLTSLIISRFVFYND